MTLEQLEKAKSYASIVSMIAVPVVLALFGWWVQQSIAEQSVRKDYVQMAVGILREAPSKENRELRAWAAEVLEHSAPVPITAALRAKLAQGVWVVPMEFPAPPTFVSDPIETCADVPKPPVSETDLNAWITTLYRQCSVNTSRLEFTRQLRLDLRKSRESP